MSWRSAAKRMRVVRPNSQFMAQLCEIGAYQAKEWTIHAGPDGVPML